MAGSAQVRGRVAEVFRSWQGEAGLLGQRQVFVRLAGCDVGCRYCDTEWAFQAPAAVPVPGASGERVENPLSAEQVAALVAAADPPEEGRPLAPVSLTGGEPLEQPDFVEALLNALAPREVMLETAGLHGEALARLGPRVRWVSCDVKLPSSSAVPDALARTEAALSTGWLGSVETWFKLVVDGDTSVDEVAAVAALLRRQAPGQRVFLQPVTPLGGSPAVPRERLDAFADALELAGLPVRVVPQVHKLLKVR